MAEDGICVPFFICFCSESCGREGQGCIQNLLCKLTSKLLMRKDYRMAQCGPSEWLARPYSNETSGTFLFLTLCVTLLSFPTPVPISSSGHRTFSHILEFSNGPLTFRVGFLLFLHCLEWIHWPLFQPSAPSTMWSTPLDQHQFPAVCHIYLKGHSLLLWKR